MQSKEQIFWQSDTRDDQTEGDWEKTKTKYAQQRFQSLLNLFLWYSVNVNIIPFWVTENKYVHCLIFLAMFQFSFKLWESVFVFVSLWWEFLWIKWSWVFDCSCYVTCKCLIVCNCMLWEFVFILINFDRENCRRQSPKVGLVN